MTKYVVKVKHATITYENWIVDVDQEFPNEDYDTLEDYLEENYQDGQYIGADLGDDETDIDDYERVHA